MTATGKSNKDGKTKVAILLNLIGEEAIEVFNTFKLNTSDSENLETVLSKFEEYCQPIKNVIFERYKFFNIVQKEGQSFDSFLTELQTAASTCEFKEEESLIRDRIVLGITDKNLQERMLREPDLTLKKAAEFCRAAEVSRQQVSALQGRQSVVSAVNLKKSSNKQVQKVSQSVQNKSVGLNSSFLCKKCGYTHQPRTCPAYNKVCASCKQKNHFAKCCPINKNSSRPKQVKRPNVHEISQADPHNVVESEELGYDDYYESEPNLDTARPSSTPSTSNLYINCLDKTNGEKPLCWYETLLLGRQRIKFKLDTGAETSVLPLRIYNQLDRAQRPPLRETNTVLLSFGNQTPIRPIGTVTMNCSSRNLQNVCVEFTVVDVISTPLLGLKDCLDLKLVAKVGINYISEHVNKEDVVTKHLDVFTGLGKFPGEINIELSENATPKVHPPRRVPLSLYAKLKDTLDELRNEGIIAEVNRPTDWVQSLVIVEKPDKTLRLCLDCKELNASIKKEPFLIPKPEEIMARLSGKTVFSVLDMKQGFWHCELNEASSYLCTFNTPFGRYRFKRLPFGICSAPEIFQKRNFDVFGDIEGCEIYFDDLIIAGSNEREHDVILNKVLQKAKDYNVKFNKDKFQFRVNSVNFVGKVVSKEGIKPDPTHVKAIKELEKPTDKKALMRLLGMSKYLSQYIPNLSKLTSSLRYLTRKNVDWNWSNEHDQAFNDLKAKLTEAPVLGIFDSSKPLLLQCDASKDGLGICLFQEGHPISYGSRSLTETEQRYAQIEKELLAITFGLERFHQLTYGRLVHVQTDHKPLVNIVNKDLSKVSARLQRLLLKLLKYQIKVEYIPGKNMFMADTLSRAYLKDTVKDDPELSYIVHSLSKHLPMTPAKKEKFKVETEKDCDLSKLKQFYFNGWPTAKNKCPSNVKFYYNLQDRITVQDDLVFLDDKLIVPSSLRNDMLSLIHESHLGIEKCKSRAREILYWPGMSKQIHETVLKCKVCERFRKSNTKQPMLSHPLPDRPWQKLAADIFQFGPNDYLVITDYYSRWLEFVTLNGKTAGHVIQKLKSIFARFGIPNTLIADNMPFNSIEFRNFASDYDFNVITSSPHYPKSNGLAEKSVSIAKNMLRRAYECNTDVYVSLMEYRNTPLKDIGLSPAQLMLSRRIKTKIPCVDSQLKPKNFDVNVKAKLTAKRSNCKSWYDKNCKPLPNLEPNESVLVQKGKTWEPGQIVRSYITPRSFIVKQNDGREVRRNRIHLRKSLNENPTFVNPELLHNPIKQPETQTQHRPTPTPETQVHNQTQSDFSPNHAPSFGTIQPTPTSLPTSRYGRLIKRPQRLDL